MQDRSINNALLALRKHVIRANADGLTHVEAFTVMQIAASRSTKSNLRDANIVPDVTLNWCAHALHLNLRRVVILYTSSCEQRGQIASPFVSGQRISQNFLYAACSPAL
jgi:hypothetical protein